MTQAKDTEHFKVSEFACHCGCGYNVVTPELLALLEEIRALYGKPVKVLSGCRCPKRNAAVGGKTKSYHLLGMAADVSIEGIPPSVVANDCEAVVGTRGGIGRYSQFTHVDVRGFKARWKGEY
jgi:uncharacterized protein YcbK (DUF882 family)